MSDKMKKKILLSLLIVVLFTITGCGKNQENNIEESNNNFIKIIDNKDFQKFLNSIEFKNENK